MARTQVGERCGGQCPAFTEADGATCIRHVESSRSLFMVHDHTGDLSYAFNLSPHIRLDVRIYGLPSIPAGQAQLRTVEGMAARLVRMVRAIQPVGPYRILGWSFGGILAYEIAMQLIAADEIVEFLGLMDAVYSHEAANLQGKLHGKEQPPDWVRPYAMAESTYSAQRIPITIELFVAEDAPFGLACGWDAVLPQNRIHTTRVPGTSSSMMAPSHVEALGHALSDAMVNSAAEAAPSVERSYSALVTLQTGSPGVAALWCIPGAGASVGSFVSLVGNLDESQPVYGFEPRGLDGALPPHATVSATASAYLRALEEVCPGGPLHLLGHSFGGWVAFEMAQRLTAQGREVLSLTIVDTEAPEEKPLTREYSHSEAIMAWIGIFEQLLERPLGIDKNDVECRTEEAVLALVHHSLVNEGLLPRNSQPQVLEGLLHTFAMALRAQFEPKTAYTEPVQLILPEALRLECAVGNAEPTDRAKKWTKWAPNLVCRQVPGNHVTLMRMPHVRELAKLICNSTRPNPVSGRA